jgi:hypothetical protein
MVCRHGIRPGQLATARCRATGLQAFANGADMAQSSAWRGAEVDITGYIKSACGRMIQFQEDGSLMIQFGTQVIQTVTRSALAAIPLIILTRKCRRPYH